MATTNAVVLQLVLMMTTTMLSLSLAGKAFRLKTLGGGVGQRSRGYYPPHPPHEFDEVLDRLNKLTSLVNDLQATVDDVRDAVKTINATVDPPVTSQCMPTVRSRIRKLETQAVVRRAVSRRRQPHHMAAARGGTPSTSNPASVTVFVTIIIIIIHEFQSDASPEELQGRCVHIVSILLPSDLDLLTA